MRDGELAGFWMQLVADAIAATVALLAAPALSVYKPWGAPAASFRMLLYRRHS